MGGKTRTDANGEVTKGWDHDPPAKEKQVPFGILMVVAGALTLLFGSRETSDAWADALQMWWQHVRAFYGHIKRLVIYLDNGPENSGRRTQFLKRMVQFADWSGLELHLVYYPPYHSKYNPIERCDPELPEGDSAMRAADDLEGSPPNRETPSRRVSRRRPGSR